jgi:hypothetical protein
MIALIFLLTLCVYANMARELLVDDESLDDEPYMPKEVIGVQFLKDSLEPLMTDNSLQLSFAFEECDNVRLSAIKDPSYILVHQAACGEMTGVRLDFSNEKFFFEFLIQLQKLMLSK